MTNRSEITWTEIKIDPSTIDLSGSDEEVILRLAKQINPPVPADLLEETFEYACYMAREYYRREMGIDNPVLSDQKTAEIRSSVIESLQAECIIRGLSKSYGIEVTEADEEKELLAEKNRTGINVKQLRKYFENHPVQSNEKYLGVLRKKLMDYLRGLKP
ncbi:MAG: hypothetical protein ACJ763_18485 [Bdellovibrionia bacterium]